MSMSMFNSNVNVNVKEQKETLNPGYLCTRAFEQVGILAGRWISQIFPPSSKPTEFPNFPEKGKGFGIQIRLSLTLINPPLNLLQIGVEVQKSGICGADAKLEMFAQFLNFAK